MENLRLPVNVTGQDKNLKEHSTISLCQFVHRQGETLPLLGFDKLYGVAFIRNFGKSLLSPQ
jgi:hypothetical protein